MIRLIGILIGLGFTTAVLWAFGWGAYAQITDPPAETAERVFHQHPKALHLASDGPFGTWDKQQLQRGYQVYKEVCSACHSLKYVAFRDLAELGYSEAEVKATAASWTVPGIDPAPARRTPARARRPTTSRRRSPTTSRRAPRTTTRSRRTCR
jgi:ubiquinol-cytochrome c reductase cytochrome c1 subunit